MIFAMDASPATIVSDTLASIHKESIIILKHHGKCPSVTQFETKRKELLLVSDEEVYCGNMSTSHATTVWSNHDGEAIMRISFNDHGVGSNKQSFKVHTPYNNSYLGQVVMRRTLTKKEKSIFDANGYQIMTFRGPTDQNVDFWNKQGTKICKMRIRNIGVQVRMEFDALCTADIRLLIMATAFHFFKKDRDERGACICDLLFGCCYN